MTERSVIQVLLLVVLVWHVAVCWCLVVRDWPCEVVEEIETTEAAAQAVQETDLGPPLLVRPLGMC